MESHSLEKENATPALLRGKHHPWPFRKKQASLASGREGLARGCGTWGRTLMVEIDLKSDGKEDEYKPEKPLHESETLSFWQSESVAAKSKRMDFMATQIKALVALKMQKQDNIPVEVSKGVYLGSIGAALSKPVLKQCGITHVLTAAGKIKPAHPDVSPPFTPGLHL